MGNTCSWGDGRGHIRLDTDTEPSENHSSSTPIVNQPHSQTPISKLASTSVNHSLTAERPLDGTSSTIQSSRLDACQNRKEFAVALIDGDNLLFKYDLIKGGIKGGLEAGRQLETAVIDFLQVSETLNVTKGDVQVNLTEIIHPQGRQVRRIARPKYIFDQELDIIVHIFMNKKGLRKALNNIVGISDRVFDDFCEGFSRSKRLFTVIDVGGVKEAADEKIKAYLKHYIEIPNCKTIFAGICHDGGFTSTITDLQSKPTFGKLLLLRGLSRSAYSIHALGMKTLVLPQVFSDHVGAKLPDPVEHVVASAVDTDSAAPNSTSPLKIRSSLVDPAKSLPKKASEVSNISVQQSVGTVTDSKPEQVIPKTHPRSTQEVKPCIWYYLKGKCIKTGEEEHESECFHDRGT
ncbi:hypothetical protein M231_03589 [Tremella mesenterica]|uniref:DUF7923 domain-containing protein n=1 Tax=Tremella mesenterica TaxID=5217 RepID=A0A4Q1BMN1_TREME|nr:hypothetical protein M231_03589 [Tremella mesenterica]